MFRVTKRQTRFIRAARWVIVATGVMLTIGWFMWASWLTTPIVHAGDATVDAAIFALQQATARAQETNSARATEVASQRATATAARQQTLEKIADDAQKTKTILDAQEVSARLTREAISAAQTQAAQTAVAQTAVAQITAQASASQTAAVRTRTADEAIAAAATRSAEATATAIARQQSQEDRDAALRSAGVVLAYIGAALVLLLFVLGIGMSIVRAARQIPAERPVVSTNDVPIMSAPPQVVFIEPPTYRIVSDPEQVAREAEEITRALSGMQPYGQGDDDEPTTIDVTPTE